MLIFHKSKHLKKDDMQNEWRKKIGKSFDFLVVASIAIQQLLVPTNPANAFPIYAQQAYKNPREANGRIVCANCHLAAKPVELEAPQSILPDQVFETTPILIRDFNFVITSIDIWHTLARINFN